MNPLSFCGVSRKICLLQKHSPQKKPAKNIRFGQDSVYFGARQAPAEAIRSELATMTEKMASAEELNKDLSIENSRRAEYQRTEALACGLRALTYTMDAPTPNEKALRSLVKKLAEAFDTTGKQSWNQQYVAIGEDLAAIAENAGSLRPRFSTLGNYTQLLSVLDIKLLSVDFELAAAAGRIHESHRLLDQIISRLETARQHPLAVVNQAVDDLTTDALKWNGFMERLPVYKQESFLKKQAALMAGRGNAGISSHEQLAELYARHHKQEPMWVAYGGFLDTVAGVFENRQLSFKELENLQQSLEMDKYGITKKLAANAIIHGRPDIEEKSLELAEKIANFRQMAYAYKLLEEDPSGASLKASAPASQAPEVADVANGFYEHLMTQWAHDKAEILQGLRELASMVNPQGKKSAEITAIEKPAKPELTRQQQDDEDFIRETLWFHDRAHKKDPPMPEAEFLIRQARIQRALGLLEKGSPDKRKYEQQVSLMNNLAYLYYRQQQSAKVEEVVFKAFSLICEQLPEGSGYGTSLCFLMRDLYKKTGQTEAQEFFSGFLGKLSDDDDFLRDDATANLQWFLNLRKQFAELMAATTPDQEAIDGCREELNMQPGDTVPLYTQMFLSPSEIKQQPKSIHPRITQGLAKLREFLKAHPQGLIQES